MNRIEPMIAGRIQRTKPMSVRPNNRAIESFVSHRFRSARSNTTREQNTAVKRLSVRPRMSVTAKPLS